MIQWKYRARVREVERELALERENERVRSTWKDENDHEGWREYH